MEELRKLFQSSIQVQSVAQPIYSIDADDNATTVRRLMETNDYHVVGVKRNGKVIGYTEIELFKKGSTTKWIKKFGANDLCSFDTPLISVLPHFIDKDFLFVTRQNEVTDITTRSDLQRIPVRMLLFGLLSLMEMHMLELIKRCYPHETWKSMLSEERLNKAEDIFNFRKERNEAIALIDCLQFADKKQLFKKTDKLVEATGKSVNTLHDFFERAEALRDNLAHVQDVTGGKSWPEVLKLVEEIRAFILLCEKLE